MGNYILTLNNLVAQSPIWYFYSVNKIGILLFQKPLLLIFHFLVSLWLLEVSGPPDFLNNCVQEVSSSRDSESQQWGHGRRRQRKEKKDLPVGKDFN